MSGAVAAPPSVRCFTRPSCGRSLPRCCRGRVELWEVALCTLPTSSGVLPGTYRTLPGRTWYVFLRTRGCGRSHSACCPRRQARFRAGPGRYRVLLGTLLHAPRLWEVALGTLPRSSGVLPGSPVLLPGRPRQASRVAQAVTRARLAHCNSDPHAVILLRLVANAGQVVSKASLVGSPWGFRERQSNCKTSPFNVLPPVSAVTTNPGARRSSLELTLVGRAFTARRGAP